MTRRQRLPSLTALRAFHAVARHRSLAQAAKELLVSPQAVGQQIRLLEEELKVTLFERKGRSIVPTETAILLHHFVRSGFDEIAEGVRRVTQSGYRDRINLNASPYFASHFLMPLLTQLPREANATDLRLTTMVDLPDFGRDDIDLAIQWGYGSWPDLDVTLLVRDPKVILCTPQLAASIRDATDLARATLLDPIKSARLWPDIFAFLGAGAVPAERKIGFDDAATMRRATLQGLGVGLISEIDADEDLKSGALVAPLGRNALGGMREEEVPGFYLVAPRSHLRVRSVAVLHQWLREQDWAAAVA